MAVRPLTEITPAELGSVESNLFIPSKVVETVDDRIEELVLDMLETMHAYPICVGLAAPQVGENLRVIVINGSEEKKGPDLILVNPVLLSATGQKDVKRESCMSLPKWTGSI